VNRVVTVCSFFVYLCCLIFYQRNRLFNVFIVTCILTGFTLVVCVNTVYHYMFNNVYSELDEDTGQNSKVSNRSKSVNTAGNEPVPLMQ